MNKILPLLTLLIISILGCSKDENETIEENNKPTTLTIKSNESGYIKQIRLVGNNFEILHISEGDSQTFTLSELPTGNSGVNIYILVIKGNFAPFRYNNEISLVKGKNNKYVLRDGLLRRN